MANEQELYYSYSSYLKNKYGEKVWRLPINTGRPCPNRLNGRQGCTFCDGVSFLPSYLSTEDDIVTQLSKGRAFFHHRNQANKFIGYFQANTNTYGPFEELIAEYRIALEQDFIVGLSISTRPDYVDAKIVRAIRDLSEEFGKEVWIELGLQSVHEVTLERIKRNHLYQDVVNALTLIKHEAPQIKTVLHMILGLPGETINMMKEGMKKIAALDLVDAIKIRPLDIEKGTLMWDEYQQYPEDFLVFTDDSFAELIVDIINILPKSMIIMRFANFKSLNKVYTSEKKYTKGTLIRRVNDLLGKSSHSKLVL